MGIDEKIKPNLEIAVFASGCFWSKEYYFSKVDGVVSTRVGFTGGHKANPTYQEVCTKTTGHAEAVEVTFDRDKISFEALARLFFEWHDPTVDRTEKGGQYRSSVFYQNEAQKTTTLHLIELLKTNGYDVKTLLEQASNFWPADARHQKYCDTRGFTPKSYNKSRFEVRSKKAVS